MAIKYEAHRTQIRRVRLALMPRTLKPLPIHPPLSQRSLDRAPVPAAQDGTLYPAGSYGYFVFRLSPRALEPVGDVPASATEISRDTGMSVATVHRVLFGKNPISAEVAATLAHTYGVPLDKLLNVDVAPNISKSGTKKDTPESGTKNRPLQNNYTDTSFLHLTYVQNRAVQQRAAVARRLLNAGPKSAEQLLRVPAAQQPNALNPMMHWSALSVNTQQGNNQLPTIPATLFLDLTVSPQLIPNVPEVFQLLAAKDYRELLLSFPVSDYIVETVEWDKLRTKMPGDMRTQEMLERNPDKEQFFSGWVIDYPKMPLQSKTHSLLLVQNRLIAETPYLTADSVNMDPTHSYEIAEEKQGIPSHPYFSPKHLAQHAENDYRISWTAIQDARRNEVFDQLTEFGWGSIPALDLNPHSAKALKTAEAFLQRHSALRPLLGEPTSKPGKPSKIKKGRK